MPTTSKWQSLPTEAINPVSLAIDKTPVRDIIEMVVNEDRKVISAVLKEKERIAHGIEIVTQALKKGGRVIFVGAGTSGRLGVVEASEMPPTFGTSPKMVQAIMAGGQEAVFRAKEGVEDNYEEGARSIAPAAADQQGRGDRRLGQRHDAVRPRRADPRPQGRRADHLRHLLAGVGAPELRRPADRPGGRARDHRRLDPPEGRHRHQDGAQHADHRSR